MKKILLSVVFLIVVITSGFAQFSIGHNQPIESTSSNPVWYFIQNKTTGNVLELQSATDGAITKTLMRPILTNSDGQLWRFERQADGKFMIINKLGAGTIKTDLTWGTTSTETFTIKWPAVGTTDRYWIINSTGGYLLSSSAASDNNLASGTSASAGNVWIFIKAPASSTSASPAYYQIASGNPNYLTINTNSPYGIQSSSANAFTQNPPSVWHDALWRVEYSSTNLAYKLVSDARETAAPGEFIQYNGTINTNANAVSTTTGVPTDFVLTPSYSADGFLAVYIKGSNTGTRGTNTASANSLTIPSAGTAQIATKAFNAGATINMRFNVQKDVDASLLCAQLVNTAKALYTPNIGTTVDKQTQAAYDALTAAYNTARNAYLNGTTSADFTSAYNTLRDATNNFYTSNIKFSSGSTEYYYTMYTSGRDNKAPDAPATAGNLLGTKLNTLPPTKANVPDNQKWIFIDLGDGTMAIKNPSTGTYISSDPQVYNVSTTPLQTTATAPTANGWSLIGSNTLGMYVIKNDRVKSTNNSNYMQFNQYGAGTLPSSNLGNWGSGTTPTSFTLNDAGSNYTFVYLGSNVSAETPVLSPASDIVVSGTFVSISSTTAGADIVYTTDGSDPATSATAITTANPAIVMVTASTKIRAIATATGWEVSAEGTGIYNVIPKVSTPGVQEYYYVMQTPLRENRVITDKGADAVLLGTTVASPTVSNTTEDERWMLVDLGDGSYSWVNKSTRNYINNASEPVNASQPGYKAKTGILTSGGWKFGFVSTLNNFIVINGTQQLHQGSTGDGTKILNYGSGTNTSDVGCIYTFVQVEEATAAAATPTVSVPAGDVVNGTSVTISTTTPNAVIHYTLDGSTPTVLSPVATGGVVTINSTTVPAGGTFTLKAVALADGLFNSIPVSVTYNVKNVAVSVSDVPTTSDAAVTFHVSVTAAGPAAVKGLSKVAAAASALDAGTFYYTTDGSTPTTSTTTTAAPETQFTITRTSVGGAASFDLNYIYAADSYVSAMQTQTIAFVVTKVNNQTEKYIIRVQNRLISVDGVADFDVYSILGQKQDKKAPLIPGIYIVKMKDASVKVQVK